MSRPRAGDRDTAEFRAAGSQPGSTRLMRSPSTGAVEVPFSAHFHLGRSGRNPDGMLVGGLRMSRTDDAPFAHVPVMAAEVVDLFAPVPAGTVLDATVGGAGHARALLAAHPHLRVVGIDQDPAAVTAASEALAGFGDRAAVSHARFDRLGEVLDDVGVELLSGALFDLGVSSPQLDRASRGFSYRADAPLDMRMDPGAARRAADVVNNMAEPELVRLLLANGEGRFARRIARAIVAARPLTTTVELAEVVKAAIPAAARRTGGHPARRAFQAVRIAVNDELAVLPGALDAAIGRLAPGGRCVVLSYHSGEDRLVKERFVTASTGGCTCPPGLPCVCGAVPTVRLLTRGSRRPTAAEVAANPRSESARLRAVERLSPSL
ncbi:MAG TPA: 16S rRNA (cytosine(1402)-N(4))-methyltransferase RsmH, partial [Acidimicrobiales bacterium]|nr:16S rRNA (cytosine(1402)-N(4))-methyltransferase RsmH [Acidimicrobiales bacterium]